MKKEFILTVRTLDADVVERIKKLSETTENAEVKQLATVCVGLNDSVKDLLAGFKQFLESGYFRVSS